MDLELNNLQWFICHETKLKPLNRKELKGSETVLSLSLYIYIYI